MAQKNITLDGKRYRFVRDESERHGNVTLVRRLYVPVGGGEPPPDAEWQTVMPQSDVEWR